jgi:DNA-binding PadR family transcriptional regulator
MEVNVKDSWIKNAGSDWSLAAAWQDIEALGNQFKRNVDMRMRRGDVRSAVLRLLHEGPMHGYQIIHEIESRSGGAWKPSPGSVYPTLQLLSDEGLIISHEADGRRTYSLTDAGREVAEAEAESPAPWLAGSERPTGPRGSLAQAGLKVAKTAAEVARTGSPEQMAKATKALDEAAQALSAILAQD